MKMKIYRDPQGNIVNIGEWNEGRVIGHNKSVVINNPKPVNLVESEEDVTVLEDGTKIVSTDYRKLRRTAYPDFREYLDGVVKGDQFQVQSYIDACLAVKTKYPKTEG